MSADRLSALVARAEEIRLRYLRAELELGVEFARISREEADLDAIRSDRSRQFAVRTSTIVHRFMSLIAGSTGKHELTRQLAELDKIISSLVRKT
jgi:hypothetical protein